MLMYDVAYIDDWEYFVVYAIVNDKVLRCLFQTQTELRQIIKKVKLHGGYFHRAAYGYENLIDLSKNCNVMLEIKNYAKELKVPFPP